jgi:membrane-associated phospholipid phosphatase
VRLRRSELFFSAYFLYAAGVALARPIPPELQKMIVALNFALIGWFVLMAWGDRFREDSYLSRVRDWYPVPLILLAYREMGWMHLPQTSLAFENRWIGLDRDLLYGWGLKAGIESLGPVIPVVLELAYLLVYVVPILGVVLFYLAGRRHRLDDYYSVLLFGTLTAYALYPWFPSEPPRTAFPGMDLPAYDGVLRKLNLFLVGNYGIHTSVFPSGHAAAAFGCAFGCMAFLPERKWAGRRQLTLAILIAVATVYGRYHFVVDTIAGFALALLGLGLTFLWQGRLAALFKARRG